MGGEEHSLQAAVEVGRLTPDRGWGRAVKYAFASLLGILTVVSCEKQEVPRLVSPVPFTAVHVSDKFWAPKIEVNRRVSIPPAAFRQCEINGRIASFALAAGVIQGEHRGDYPLDDTDVYEVTEGASYALAAGQVAKEACYE
jgi:hypothetical protein